MAILSRSFCCSLNESIFLSDFSHFGIVGCRLSNSCMCYFIAHAHFSQGSSSSFTRWYTPSRGRLASTSTLTNLPAPTRRTRAAYCPRPHTWLGRQPKGCMASTREQPARSQAAASAPMSQPSATWRSWFFKKLQQLKYKL